jgi:hypothetical protein
VVEDQTMQGVITKQPGGCLAALFSPSTLLLVAANVATGYVAIAQDWNFGTLVWSFWAQSMVIGFFVVLRILGFREFSTKGMKANGQPIPETAGGKWQGALFFALHFGLFHFVYAVFLWQRFDGVDARAIGTTSLLFAAHHFVSYWQAHQEDLLGKPNLGRVMMAPYVRIAPMHLLILIPSGGILFFLWLKGIVDVAGHLVRRVALEKAPAAKA